MLVDRKFMLSISTQSGQKVLRFACARDLAIGEASTILFAASLDELCDLAGMRAADRDSMAADKERTIFSNGWQSWCFAGELDAGERVERARIVPHIRAYCDGPGRPEARGEVLSHFLTYVRSGKRRLVLVSRGSLDRAGPPLAFRIDRESLNVSAEFAAGGARFAAGERVAEIRLFFRESFFEMKDALWDAFADYRLYDRLAFLGPEPEAGTPDGGRGRLVPGGYESWYNHYTRIDERIIASDLESIDANDNLINAYYLKRGKPTVFQIDDGWELAVGSWEPDPRKFPGGMKAFAESIEAKGMVPGIWLAPLLVTKSSANFKDRAEWLLRDSRGRPVAAGFNPGWDGSFYCLDISLPEVGDYLAGLFDTIVELWGYRYLKLDFLYAGFLPGVLRGGGAAFEHYDRLMARLTSRIANSKGAGVAYLGCGAPLESSFRHFPLMRIGADTKEVWDDWLLKRVVRHQGRPAAYTNLTHSLGRSCLDGAVFVNDPDVVFCRTKGMGYGEREKELIAIVDFMLASQIMFSDDAHEFGLSAEEADFTKRIVALFDELTGGDYGAERLGRDVYSIESRDGRIRGLINLSDRGYPARGFEDARPIVSRMERGAGGELSFMPRSISLFAK